MGRQCEVSGKKTSFGNHITTRGKAKYLGGVGIKCTGVSRADVQAELAADPRLAAQRHHPLRPRRHLGHPHRACSPSRSTARCRPSRSSRPPRAAPRRGPN